MIENLVLKDGIPIYLQLIMHIKQGIVSENIKNNDEMPSRRMVSTMLGVNPNTVQKAYKILEDEGLIASSVGAKSYITIDENKIMLLKQELIEQNIKDFLVVFKQMGMDKKDVIRLIENMWENEEGK